MFRLFQKSKPSPSTEQLTTLTSSQIADIQKIISEFNTGSTLLINNLKSLALSPQDKVLLSSMLMSHLKNELIYLRDFDLQRLKLVKGTPDHELLFGADAVSQLQSYIDERNKDMAEILTFCASLGDKEAVIVALKEGLLIDRSRKHNQSISQELVTLSKHS